MPPRSQRSSRSGKRADRTVSFYECLDQFGARIPPMSWPEKRLQQVETGEKVAAVCRQMGLGAMCSAPIQVRGPRLMRSWV